jgi:hypothetical protein
MTRRVTEDVARNAVPIPAGARNILFRSKLFRDGWSMFRGAQCERDYRKRRERYTKQAAQDGTVYVQNEIVAQIRNRIAERNYRVHKREVGEIHTFAFIPQISWHASLLPDLRELGPLTLFDYTALGYKDQSALGCSAEGIAQRAAYNALVVPALLRAHRQRPVDWFFAYASGLELSRDTVRRIEEETGIPTVGVCFDDKQSWVGYWMGDHRAGQIDLVSAFDLSWTSARVACEWYMVEGGRPIYMPEGFDAATFMPQAMTPDLDVSFIGSSYGRRPSIVDSLRKAGIDVRTFGAGWNGTDWEPDIVRIMSRSKINLGLGYLGYSDSLTNVKGRDFEVPAVGGGVYLTTYNADLSQHFNIGEEILCYNNIDEMIELIRYYLRDTNAAREVAHKGRLRCLAEHRWLHRYLQICRHLGIGN